MTTRAIAERKRIRDEVYRLLGELRALSTAPASSEAHELAARAVDAMVSDEGNPEAVLRAYGMLGAPTLVTVPQLAKILGRDRSVLDRQLKRLHANDRAKGKGTWMVEGFGDGQERSHHRINLSRLAAEHEELFPSPPHLAPGVKELIVAVIDKRVADVEHDVKRREAVVFAALKRHSRPRT